MSSVNGYALEPVSIVPSHGKHFIYARRKCHSGMWGSKKKKKRKQCQEIFYIFCNNTSYICHANYVYQEGGMRRNEVGLKQNAVVKFLKRIIGECKRECLIEGFVMKMNLFIIIIQLNKYNSKTNFGDKQYYDLSL